MSTRRGQKRVLGVVGSPRRAGNTETLVDQVLRGAEEAGAQTIKIALSSLTIGPCQACEACKRGQPCAQMDDMVGVLASMQRSDVWVLGTPVYWWGPTAQFKAFLDRWYGADSTTFQRRQAVLVIPLGDTDVATARHTVGMLEDALRYIKVDLVDVLLGPGLVEPDDARRREDLMERARQIGQQVALARW